MKSLLIIEDKKARKWRVKSICSIFLTVLKKYGAISLVLVIAAHYLCSIFNIPIKTCRVIQVLLGLPILLPILVIIGSPAFFIPQKWSISSTKIVAKGLREFGSIRKKNIKSFAINDIKTLAGYKKINIKSICWLGTEGASFEILVPPTVDIQQVEKHLTN